MTKPTDPLRRAWYELCRAVIAARTYAELVKAMERMAMAVTVLEITERLIGFIADGAIPPGDFATGGVIRPGSFAPHIV